MANDNLVIARRTGDTTSAISALITTANPADQVRWLASLLVHLYDAVEHPADCPTCFVICVAVPRLRAALDSAGGTVADAT